MHSFLKYIFDFAAETVWQQIVIVMEIWSRSEKSTFFYQVFFMGGGGEGGRGGGLNCQFTKRVVGHVTPTRRLTDPHIFSASPLQLLNGFWWNLTGISSNSQRPQISLCFQTDPRMKNSWSLTSVVVLRSDPHRVSPRASKRKLQMATSWQTFRPKGVIYRINYCCFPFYSEVKKTC